jgi:hypothetical protein
MLAVPVSVVHKVRRVMTALSTDGAALHYSTVHSCKHYIKYLGIQLQHQCMLSASMHAECMYIYMLRTSCQSTACDGGAVYNCEHHIKH